MRFEVTEIGEEDTKMYFLTMNGEHILSTEKLKEIKEKISKYLEARFN